MAGVEERVVETIKTDPFLYETLARGVLNKSATARWIQQHRGIDAEVETIRSAISELEAGGELSSVAEVHPLLATASLELRPDVGSITLQRRQALKSQLMTFLESLSISHGEPFHSAIDEEEILLVVQQDRLQEAQGVFDSDLVLGIEEELTRMTFHVEDRSGFGLLGIVLEVLELADIEVVTVDGNRRRPTVVVPTRQQRLAVRMVDSFGVQAES